MMINEVNDTAHFRSSRRRRRLTAVSGLTEMISSIVNRSFVLPRRNEWQQLTVTSGDRGTLRVRLRQISTLFILMKSRRV